MTTMLCLNLLVHDSCDSLFINTDVSHLHDDFFGESEQFRILTSLLRLQKVAG